MPIPTAAIAAFCRKWQVTEFALFGAVVSDDFGPESDVDVLVSFGPRARDSLFDLAEMQNELSEVFGRDVALVTRRAVERGTNEWRRKAILESLVAVNLSS